MIEQLVDVFRQVARIGESSVVGATIKITKSLVWVVAFSRWCLGYTPKVLWLEVSGTNILSDDPQSRITIVACDRSSDFSLGNDIEIAIHDGVGTRLNRLIAPGYSGDKLGTLWVRWEGMVSVPEYGAWRIHQLQLDHHLPELDEYKVCAVPLVGRLFQVDALDQRKVPSQMTVQRFNPFRDYKGFDEAYEILFQRAPPEWELSGRETEVSLRKMCASLQEPDSFWVSASGRVKWNIDSLIQLTLDLFAISMLVSPETARCRMGSSVLHDDYIDVVLVYLKDSCEAILEGKSMDDSISRLPLTEDIFEDMLSWAGKLFGQDSYAYTHLLSSNRGQSMYLELYESLTLWTTGYLRLSLLPGVIRYKNETYPGLLEMRVVEDGHRPWEDAMTPILTATTVGLNQYPGCSVQWVVTVYGFNSLRAWLQLVREGGEFVARARPSNTLKSMASAIMAVACEHAAGTAVPPDAAAKAVPMAYIGMEKTSVPLGAVGVVSVSGSQHLRFMAAAVHWDEDLVGSSELSMVIRQEACFDCCIQLCVINDIRTLIL